MIKLRKETIKKVGKGFCALAIIVATVEANAPCPYISYQPEKPESVKKLRKF